MLLTESPLGGSTPSLTAIYVIMKYKLEDFDPKNNKTVCTAAWSHLHLFTDGKAYPCCLNTTSPYMDYNDKNISEIWNCNNIKKFRIDTLNGIEQPSCAICYDQEKLGSHSFRMSFWDRTENEIPEILESTEDDGTVEKTSLIYWDFRFSNVCNLKCRTCGVTYSSSWGEELSKFNPSLLGDYPALRQGKSKNILKSLENDNQYDIVKHIYFAGGEPLITNEHYTILNTLIEKNRTDVKINYNTNFMNLRFKSKPIFEWWNQFKDVTLQTSIDGINERGEYIRKGFKMETYVNNLIEVRKNSPHVKIGASITVSILNSFHLFDLIDELVFKLKINPDEININFVYGPEIYCIQNLTDNLKEEWLKLYDSRILKYKLIKKIKNLDNIVIIFNEIKAFIFNKNTLDGNIRNLQKETKFYDKIRDENVLEIFPELNELFTMKPKSNLI